MTSTSMPPWASPEDPTCTSCDKLQSSLPEPLKRCAKCQTARYCSRDCQNLDWKTHKRTCGQPEGDANASQHNPGFHALNKLLGVSDDKYLHNLPEKDVFAQLIDCFRLRCEGEYTFTGDGMGIYGGEIEDAMESFEGFLDMAEERATVLPA